MGTRTLPTTGGFMGHGFQLIGGPVKVASTTVVDPFPLDALALDGSLVEVTGPHTPPSARVEVPLYPPVDWLTDAAADEAPEHLTIYPTGRVAGVVAPKDRCLLDGGPTCWTVPRPADGRGSTLEGGADEEYQMARGAGDLYLADGTVIAAAPLPGEGGHAGGWLAPQAASDHYANTANQVARGRYVWSDTAGGVGGIVFVGALAPTITEQRLIVARGSASSIDFRWIDDENRYRLVGCCNVNIAGLPTRYRKAVMAGASFAIPFDPTPTKEAPMGTTTKTPCSCEATKTAAPRLERYQRQAAPKLAAYKLEPIDTSEPQWDAQVTWGDGKFGQYDGQVNAEDGTVLWMIRPEVDGELADYDERIAVPAAEVTLTGMRYEWESADDNAVLAAGGPAEPADVTMKYPNGDIFIGRYAGPKAAAVSPADSPAHDPELGSQIQSLSDRLDEVLAMVSDIQQALVQEAISDSDV